MTAHRNAQTPLPASRIVLPHHWVRLHAWNKEGRNMAPIVEIRGLSKVYDDGFEALKSIDLAIEEGEIIALLGPNGAGKTTLISTLCGITVPSGGAAIVGGHDIQTD